MPPGSAVLEVQADTGLEELAGEEEDNAFDFETMNALKQYAGKVRTLRRFHGAPVARVAGVVSASGLGLNCLLFISLSVCLVFSNTSFEKRNRTVSPLTGGWQLGT